MMFKPHTGILFLLVQCPRLFAPVNGMIDCSLGPNNIADEGEMCRLTCDMGMKLSGSASKTCQNDRSWSGTDTMCMASTVCIFRHCGMDKTVK